MTSCSVASPLQGGLLLSPRICFHFTPTEHRTGGELSWEFTFAEERIDILFIVLFCLNVRYQQKDRMMRWGIHIRCVLQDNEDWWMGRSWQSNIQDIMLLQSIWAAILGAFKYSYHLILPAIPPWPASIDSPLTWAQTLTREYSWKRCQCHHSRQKIRLNGKINHIKLLSPDCDQCPAHCIVVVVVSGQ